MKLFARGLVATVLALGMSVAVSAAASAATLPLATTGSASSITSSSAVVSGSVNPDGEATTYVFQYGPTTNYGSQTTTTAAGAGTTSTAVQAPLSGLSSNTTYHFRIVATNVDGTTAGADAAFTTATTPPVATTGTASLITRNSAVINATVNADGKTTSYTFQYGPTTNYGSQTPTAPAGSGTSATAVQAAVGGLSSNTTYHFRVVATSADGATVGTDAVFTTSKTPPTATTGFPSVVASSSAVVNAKINANGKATTYIFQYGPTTNYGAQTSPTAAGSGIRNTTVYATLSSRVAATTYHYRVVATNADGTAVSADAAFETTGTRVAPAGALPVVSEAVAVAISAHGVQLNGAINPAGSSTTWYFELGLTTNYGLQTTSRNVAGLGVRPVNVRLAGLQSASTYHSVSSPTARTGCTSGPTTHSARNKRYASEPPRSRSTLSHNAATAFSALRSPASCSCPPRSRPPPAAMAPWQSKSGAAAQRQSPYDRHCFVPTVPTV